MNADNTVTEPMGPEGREARGGENTITEVATRRVNNDSTQTDQWNPSVALSPDGSQIFVGFYSRQDDPVDNSNIKAYGATANIANGLEKATFDVFPISSTAFPPLFAGDTQTTPPESPWLFDHVWPQDRVCFDQNAIYCCPADQFNQCPPWPDGTPFDDTFGLNHDYSWSGGNGSYFYFAWCDRSATCLIGGHSRADANVKFGRIRR